MTKKSQPRPEWQLRIEARWETHKPDPFRLTREVIPGLYQVRTRGSRAYLAVDGRNVSVIDTGSLGSGVRVLQAVKELGLSAEDIQHVIVTHYHLDHVGGLPELQRHVGARTAIHLLEAPFVESQERLPNPFQHPLVARVMESWLQRNDPGAARVDLLLDDGDELPVLGGMRVVHAPGHTAGSISLHFPDRGLLLVGDAMQYKFGRLMLPARMFSEDMEQAAASVRRLSRLDFETLAFSHFKPIINGASQRLREFALLLPEGPSFADSDSLAG